LLDKGGIQKLHVWLESVSGQKVSFMVSVIGNELLIDTAKNHKDLIERAEILRTVLHLALTWEEKHTQESIVEFLLYLTRLENYGHVLPVASFGLGDGVSVMTLHKSKGLEFVLKFFTDNLTCL
jgi:superfamily I DNA/RNA helicase